jgi:ABC-type tungstate transport system permease subunit
VSIKTSARVNQADARKFAAFLLASATQQRLAKFSTDTFGEPLFFTEITGQNH